jgi:hypothetical protein
MNIRTLSILLSMSVPFLLSACANMPTSSSQITGSYTSSLKYDQYSCPKLIAELNSLARRENQLVIAQEQRVKSSQLQAFWLGYGTGDGIEASELANVRGEKEAVRSAIDEKACASTNNDIDTPSSNLIN